MRSQSEDAHAAAAVAHEGPLGITHQRGDPARARAQAAAAAAIAAATAAALPGNRVPGGPGGVLGA
jgi:hypothetical protein